jgi:hypothetical protein
MQASASRRLNGFHVRYTRTALPTVAPTVGVNLAWIDQPAAPGRPAMCVTSSLQPDVAARILARYMKDRGIDKLAERGDWQGVRRAVNGGLNGWDRFSSLVNQLSR